MSQRCQNLYEVLLIYFRISTISRLLFRSAHRTTNFTNPEFQFPQFKVLQSVLIVLCVKSYIGIF